MSIILETPRLVLRYQVLSDLDDLWALYCTNITRYIPHAPRSREEAREEFEWHMHGHPKNPELGLWATIHTETGKFIGRGSVLPWMHALPKRSPRRIQLVLDLFNRKIKTERLFRRSVCTVTDGIHPGFMPVNSASTFPVRS